MSEAPGAGPGWAEVVYGRTRLADFWWRAVPSGTERHGWLTEVVAATLGGGHGLADGPRFVLARGSAGTLVGVGCRARELDDVMHTDGRRPLFCFVGWLHAPGPVAVPGLDTLEEHYVRWAAPAYARWMNPAWEEHPSRLREPSPSVAGPPPWPEPASAAAEPFEPRPGRIRVHPAAERAQVWARTAGAAGPVALTTGWRTHRDGVARVASDVCADDVDDTVPDVVLTPPPPRTPPRTVLTGPTTTGPPPTDGARARTATRQEDPNDAQGSFLSSTVGSIGRGLQAASDLADAMARLAGGGHRAERNDGPATAPAEPETRAETPTSDRRGRSRAPKGAGTQRAGWWSNTSRSDGQIEIDDAPAASARSASTRSASARPVPPRSVPPRSVPPRSVPPQPAPPQPAPHRDPEPVRPVEPDPTPDRPAPSGGADGGPDRPPAIGETTPGLARDGSPHARPLRAAEAFGDRREVGPGSDDPDDGTFDEF